MKQLVRTISKVVILLGIIAVVSTIVPTVYARGGGGGSGGGHGGGGGGHGGSGSGSFCNHFPKGERRAKCEKTAGDLIVITMIGGIFVGTYASYKARKYYQKKVQDIANKVAQLAAVDPSWNTNTILVETRAIFLQFQNAWQNFDYATMRQITTPHYYQRIELIMHLLYSMRRKNTMDSITIMRQNIANIQDVAGVVGDRVLVEFNVKMNDRLLQDSAEIMVDTDPFYEGWYFLRTATGWVVETIVQNTTTMGGFLDGFNGGTESDSIVVPEIQQFALQNNFIYDVDFGRLLIPTAGKFFSGISQSTANIDNNVIGIYRNLLITMYTLTEYSSGGSITATHIVAQAVLPKSYHHIYVRPKTRFSGIGGLLLGMRRHKLESNQFNSQFEVYSDERDNIAAFELIEPQFMQFLLSLQHTYAFEVVDNIIYFYAPLYTTVGGVVDYQELFAILREAFVRMRL